MASIFLRGMVWWISYYPHPGSKPIQRSLKTKDKTVAKYKKNELENELAKGESPIPDFSISPFVVLDEYVAASKHRNKQRTISDDKARIKGFLEWAKKPRIKDICEADILTYLNDRLDKKEIIPNTANHTITNIKTLLNFAVRRGYLTRNPINGIKKYKVEKLPPFFLSKDGINKVMDAARPEKIYPMIAMAIYTGMRLGELKRITWGDIDFGRDEVMVRLSKPGKFRAIPMHPTLKKILRPVAGKPDATCFDLQNLRRIFRRVCLNSKNFKKVKLDKPRKWRIITTIGWHTFRHTFASQLVMSGVDLVTVSKLLGHASINTTMIYSHLSQEHIKDSVNSLAF